MGGAPLEDTDDGPAGSTEDEVGVRPWCRAFVDDGAVVGVEDGVGVGVDHGVGVGEVVPGPAAVEGVVVNVPEARELIGAVWGAGRVAFGSRDSTLVFSRFTSSIRSCLRLPSFTDCKLLLTTAS